MSASRSDYVQHLYTLTPNSAPPNNWLTPGEIGLELADPMKLWVGVPVSMDPTGRKLLYGTSSVLPGGPYLPLTGGTLAGPGNLVVNGSVQLGMAGNTANVIIGAAATTTLSILSFQVVGTKQVNFQQGSVNRWRLQVGGTESGSNAGSDLTLARYTDAGGSLGNALSIIRSTGAVSIFGPTTLSSTLSVGDVQTSVGINFGATVASSATDLSKHLTLYNPGFGMNVTSGRLNIVGQSVVSVVANVDRLTVSSSAVTATVPVVLPADPTTALQAATKQYVDTKIGDAPNNTFSYGRKALAWVVVPQLTSVAVNVGFDLNTITGTGAGPFTNYIGFHQIANQITPPGVNFPAGVNTGFVLTGYNSNPGWDSQLFMGAMTTLPQLYYRASSGQGTYGAWFMLITSAGGTLTGPLTLAADPTTALQAATKQYVDARAGGITEAPTDGTVYGRRGSTASWLGVLPLTGGHVTGPVTIDGVTGVGVTPPVGILPGSFYTSQATVGAIGINLYSDGTNWKYQTASGGAGLIAVSNGAPGGLIFYSAPLSTGLGATASLSGTLAINPGGLAVTGVLNVSSTMGVTGVITGQSDINAAGSVSVGSRVTSNDTMNVTGNFYVANNFAYYFQRSSSDGAWRWVSNGNVDMTLNPGGALVLPRGLNPDATGNWAMFNNNGGYRIHQYSPGWNWSWNINNGTLQYATPGGTNWQFNAVGDYSSVNFAGYVGGNGAYVNVSDERTKVEIADAPHGLDHILAMRPITFRRVHAKTNKPHDRTELGFSAQQIRDTFPEAVVQMAAPSELKATAGDGPILAVQSDAIVAALVNAVRTLNDMNATLAARVAALEQGTVH